ncbi:MAG: TRAP transporter small permease subunit [Deinococcus sp.]|nr:TRAP transporter small permease subunit [Deinococcus sp.]
MGTLIFLLPFVGFVFFASLEFVRESWGEMSPDPGGLPRYPIRAAIPVAMALLFLQGVSELIKRIAFLSGRAEYKLQAEHAEEVV